MSRIHPKVLLVEGAEDRRVLPYLLENYFPWPDDNRPVHIQDFDGVEQLLKPGTIEATLKSPGLQALGILIDADEDPSGRWLSVRARCTKAFPALPYVLPEAGLIVESDGLRLGVWVMPDNRSSGMLESFLAGCIPTRGETLWTFAKSCCDQSRQFGSSFKEVHLDKARIHTWLAWQDPPGEQLHLAFPIKSLQPSAAIETFVDWFQRLFDLERTETTPTAAPQ